MERFVFHWNAHPSVIQHQACKFGTDTNELLHYKSATNVEFERKRLSSELLKLGHTRPTGWGSSGLSYFPFDCFMADCAAWAVETCVEFINEFYARIGVPSSLDAYADRLCARPAST